MSTRVGRRVEQQVVAWLADRGWMIVGTNVRVGRDEIDIVAIDGTALVVVEVRARASVERGHPSETIRNAKAARLRRAAIRYAADREWDELRIDVVAVTGESIELIENAIDFTTT